MHSAAAVAGDQLQNITDALQATLDPRISNELRAQALAHLEQVKTQQDAPYHGFKLANDRSQNDAVRYYGLQLLEYALRYQWNGYSDEQTEQLAEWVKSLAAGIFPQDALFLRNKIAQLWVELAKRSWGGSWMDMDKSLVDMWDRPLTEKGMANKILVLYILETLSEDIVNSEDAVAGLRLEVLGNALNEIMVPESLYLDHNGTRGDRTEFRHGKEGWLARTCSFFSDCVKEIRMGLSSERTGDLSQCAIKSLNTVRPTISWINVRAAVAVNFIDCLFLPFYTEDMPLQTAATEVMYALLVRPYHVHWHEAMATLLQQCLTAERVTVLRQAFERSQCLPGESDTKYTLQKKLAEVLSLLADDIAIRPELLDSKADLRGFFDLLTIVLQSRSLVVSIPVLHSWSRLMTSQDKTIKELVLSALGTLIQICSERLLRYEAVSEDTEDAVVQFLYEDFDTMPERHAFLGNYRRYCTTIIQSIARTKPLEALAHVMEQMRSLLETGPYSGARGFETGAFSKTSLPFLRFDAQYSVVSSTLKGYSLWCADVASLDQADSLQRNVDQDRASVTESLQQWSYTVMNMHVDDPEVAAQVLQTLVLILKTVEASSDFVLRVVQHLLTMRLYDNPDQAAFSEAVKTFEALRVLELQKLALAFSNELLDVYHELEPRIGVLAQKHSDEPRLEWGFRAFLFMIIHRAASIDDETRLLRLRTMLTPVYESWQAPRLHTTVSSLAAFCEALALGDLAEFYDKYEFNRTPDWSSRQLDRQGQAKQAQIKACHDVLPLRMTKCMLTATTEKLRSGTSEFKVGSVLWAELVPVILPDLLQLLRHAQAFHNMENWSALPTDMQNAIRKTLQDRFWQSGISNESKDEFYARISGSKTSYEGFASVVRGTMRNVREQGYHIIYLMAKFDEPFYGLTDLPHRLADALFSDAGSLPANHLHPIINLTTGLVQRCPARHRARFLPPLLTPFFTALDKKISADWDAIGAASEQRAEDDELSDEMRVESVLRQLTYSMVSFVPFLLEYDKISGPPANGENKVSLSELVLTNDAVLVPMMLFCTHALRMRDTRCCTTICRVFRTIVPSYASGNSAMENQVREFVSTEVLKACITSLNEPYFADMQKDLAALIAQIVRLYGSRTSIPRDVILSLPGMAVGRVDAALEKLSKATSERHQRALILELLEGVRGVSIHTVGKIDTPRKNARATTAMQQQYMEVEARPAVTNGEEVGLESVADLFGDA